MLTIISIFAFMARTRVPAEVTFLGALTVLLVSGVVTEEEGMSGFGSEPVVIHAAFFVIIAGLMQSGVLYWLTKNVLGEPGNYHRALIRLMVPTAVLGAVLNSVNVVALFIDAVKIWARKLNIARRSLYAANGAVDESVCPSVARIVAHHCRYGHGHSAATVHSLA